ncbi:uncharacterized protein IUM83_18128 [Phytophthora cinnamomi]|uniref:uncharacterized protein n=1 Tax=Phytophthora cinnamomi TaxID=4785 RepID=UPI00355A6AC8|nr:hypothetical protein IUM83_18128 [Phytophthora cinnamomi]
MAYLGDDSTSTSLTADTDFDMNLLSEFLFQADGMPTLTQKENDAQASGTVATGSTDGASSSDDASASSESPAFTPPSNSATKSKTLDRKAKRRAQVAVSARRHRYRKKHEMLDLKQEMVDLTDQLHTLRAKHKLLRPDGGVAGLEEHAMAERHKRRQAEKVNEQLRRALVMQRRFFASMQSFVLNSPETNAELNMCSLLHTYTRLGRTVHSRRRDYLALCTDSKAELAVQILLRETEGMDYAGPPSMVTSLVPVPDPQQQAMTTVATYAFEFLDLKSVFVSACSAILGCGTDWPGYAAVSQKGEVVGKPQGNISYAKTDTCYRCTAAVEGDQPAEVSVESRPLVFYRMSDSYGVLVWDFADEDDLYPVKPETKVKRDVVGAAMVRRELCRDGVERVVYRSICTKRQSFPPVATAPELSHFLDMAEEGAKVCGFTVFDHIREHASEARMISV